VVEKTPWLRNGIKEADRPCKIRKSG